MPSAPSGLCVRAGGGCQPQRSWRLLDKLHVPLPWLRWAPWPGGAYCGLPCAMSPYHVPCPNPRICSVLPTSWTGQGKRRSLPTPNPSGFHVLLLAAM